MIDLEEIAFSFWCNEDIDAADGKPDMVKGFFGEFFCFLVQFDQFDGAAEREIGAEIAFFREAPHGVDVFADDKDTEVFFVGDKLLDEVAGGRIAIFLRLSDKLG